MYGTTALASLNPLLSFSSVVSSAAVCGPIPGTVWGSLLRLGLSCRGTVGNVAAATPSVASWRNRLGSHCLKTTSCHMVLHEFDARSGHC